MNRDTKRYWKTLATTWGEDVASLMDAYEALVSIDQVALDQEREIRVMATRIMFPQYRSPERWWVLLHQRIAAIVGDSDLTRLYNFDDVSRQLAGAFPELDRGEALETTQFVFEVLAGTPGHMLVPSISERMRKAWEMAFGYAAPGAEEAAELQGTLAEVPF